MGGWSSSVTRAQKRAASYVDRVLKGEQPVDWTRAGAEHVRKALAFKCALSLFARADETID